MENVIWHMLIQMSFAFTSKKYFNFDISLILEQNFGSKGFSSLEINPDQFFIKY